ncbi:MAG: HU family DNA-binding protein [Spirochaetales bacterium]|nr:HU family DNA-binding protein [Spirochaetales bacterium]
MNKQELVRELSQTLDISQKTVRHTLDALLEEVVQVLEEGENYTQTGFGTFRTEVSQERISYNPSLKRRMLLPKKRKVKFRPSAKLKGRINE